MSAIPIPPLVMDAVDRVMKGFKKRMENYLQNFISKNAKSFLEFYSKFTLGDPETIKLTVKYPIDDKGSYMDVPYEFQAITMVNIQMHDLNFNNAQVYFDFPPILLGPSGIVPQIVFKVKSPVAYPGNMGLVWEGTDPEIKNYAFHPFQTRETMRDDLIGYYKEGVVDQFCDFLNRNPNNEKLINICRAFIEELESGKYKKLLKYQSEVLKPYMAIQIPVIGEFNEAANVTTFNFRSWAIGEEYIPITDTIMNLLEPICYVVAKFDEKGDLKPESGGAQPTEQMPQNTRDRRVLLSKKDKMKDRLDSDPFKQAEKRVERDEFGFVIDKKAGFSTRETVAARKSLVEIQQDLAKKAAAAPTTRDTKHVQKYATPEAWFEANQGKRFILKGETVGLPFLEKANVETIKGCNPPFILRFARDQIRVKRSCTSQEAVKILFSVYNLGFLFET